MLSFKWKFIRLFFVAVLLIMSTTAIAVSLTENSQASSWSIAWPKTDFSKHSIPLSEIMSGGPARDGIPPIDNPKFKSVDKIKNIQPKEPVISLVVNGEAKAYPLQVMTWHEIVNDRIGNIPVTVTYCPLCNAAIVFDRRLDGKILDFGTSGKLRHSDLIMYDRQTESWWQQFLGESVVGVMTGAKLKRIPARLESFQRFKKKYPEAMVLVPNNKMSRQYGSNPYAGYDGLQKPFLYNGAMPKDLAPMMRVVVVNKTAWTLPLIQKKSPLEVSINNKAFIINWSSGQNSALDTRAIAKGRDVGNITVQQKHKDGSLDDVPYDVTFAFVFHAFYPDSIINQ